MSDSAPPEAGTESGPAPTVARRGVLLRRWVIEPLWHPTGKQKEAYARFFHTLSAGCIIGAVTVAFGGSGLDVATKTVVLIVLGVALFFLAATLAKGESQ